MARTDDLPEEAIASVGEEISRCVAADLGRRVEDVSVGTSLRVEICRFDARRKSDPTPGSTVRLTDDWHHQVYVGDDPLYYARSCQDSKRGGWRLRYIVRSPLGKGIDDALRDLVSDASGDPLVRYVTVPDYAVQGLVLVDGESISFVPVVGSRFYPSIEMGRLYSGEHLIRLLKTLKPIQKLPWRRRTGGDVGRA